MSLMAEEGIRALACGLKGIVLNASDMDARSDCLYGSWLCGSVLGHVGMALHHKLCHVLGGSFNLPHAETHTIILPHALAYNADAAPGAMQRIARALGVARAAEGTFDLAQQLGAPMALRDIGLREEDLEAVCKISMSNPYWNPRPLEAAPLMQLLRNAWAGQRPNT